MHGDRLPRLPGQSSDLTLRGKLVIVCSLVPIVVGIALLPFLLLSLPDPHPVRIPGLSGEIAGTYIMRKDGLYRLFAYTAPAMSFPEDALIVDDVRPEVIVKFRQLDRLSLYGIDSYSDAREIPVEKTVDEANKALRLRTRAALPTGEYVIVAARDGADAGWDYFYFRVP